MVGKLKIFHLSLLLTLLGMVNLHCDREIIVGNVDLQVHGAVSMNQEAIFSRIKLKPGTVFRQELNDASIRALYDTHLFDYVEVLTKEGVNDGRLDVLYVLHSKHLLEKVHLQGNESISTRKLRRIIQSKERQPLDLATVESDRIALEEFYRKHGYGDISVSQEFNGEGREDLTFCIHEGPQFCIRKILFEGNHAVTSSQLRKLLQTQKRGIFSFLNGTGYYMPAMVRSDVEKLRLFYKDRGFLDVIIDETKILRQPYGDGKSIILTVPIEEGEQFFLGKVDIIGNQAIEELPLKKRMDLRSGDHFSPTRIDGAEAAIRQFYGQAGYMETYVTIQRKPNVKDNSIDVTFEIHESEKCRVGTIQIQGNVKTKNGVILRELSLFPGDTFDLVKMKNSENRLRETRYFSEVMLAPESSAIPNYRDVVVSVEEAKTGKYYLGGAISSRDSVIGYVEFSQSNFDLANRKMAYQGAGQKFRMRLETGTRSQQALLSFEEPWLFQRELAFGADLFHTKNEYKKTDHNYDGDSYSERHKGFDLYMRKRIVELLEGRIYYDLKQVELYDVSPYASASIQAEAMKGPQWISKVGLNLQRDTRDSLLYPTVGNKMICSIDYAGLGGEVYYLNLDLQLGQWFKLINSPLQTISFLGKMGSMKPFRGRSIPYFDRKFLGGVQNMRGFEFHAVGPRDYSGSPCGAISYLYGCSEYSYRLSDLCRLVFFAEGAYVGREFMKIDHHLYGDWGVEVRLFVMGSPLRLIFGYPLCGVEPYGHRLQFNFTFGPIF
ncbi:MAG: outer membrane protein assembly factor BamA [Puniceicoccales bacterium]|jgi:outer membrane protein insertion porin family|nr:outer membrane protein assembly factor BamA [Puniceicoccales bacterium]